jgi:hypothetical protein
VRIVLLLKAPKIEDAEGFPHVMVGRPKPENAIGVSNRANRNRAHASITGGPNRAFDVHFAKTAGFLTKALPWRASVPQMVLLASLVAFTYAYVLPGVKPKLRCNSAT